MTLLAIFSQSHNANNLLVLSWCALIGTTLHIWKTFSDEESGIDGLCAKCVKTFGDEETV